MASRLADLRYIEGISLGIAASSFFGVLFVAFIFRQDGIEQFSNLALAWVAIFSAYLAVRSVRFQIEHNQTIEDERLQRKARSNIAMLPLILNDLYRASWSVSAALWKLDDMRLSEWRHLSQRISELREIIESCDEHSGSQLAWLASRLQVLTARTETILDSDGFSQMKADQDDFESGWTTVRRSVRVYDWLSFMRSIESAFSFSRGEVKVLSLDRKPAPEEVRKLLEFRIDHNAQNNPIWPKFLSLCKRYEANPTLDEV